MERADLERRLGAAADYEECVAALARFFTEHGLAFGHGTDNAADEAFWLLKHLQHWRDGAWHEPPDRRLLAAAIEIAHRRVVERVPLAYLLGEAWFAGLRFKVDRRVLVPRSPLAEVIERGFAPWCDLNDGDRVLDIGTGSGCLAIAAARYCPRVLVDATDVSADALAVAAANVALHEVGACVRLHQADLFPPGAERYRVIMSNPPYVPAHEVPTLPEEYRHEPAIGLAGGATGFDPAVRILRGAPQRLTPDGMLFVEVGAGAEAFAALYPRLPLIWLEMERGGDGVFAIGAADLENFLGGG
jgi:ribosomal protein L3 glutamine methyltransferase